MRAEYRNGLPTKQFRNYINEFIERKWPGTMASRGRSRAMDAMDPRDRDPGFGFAERKEERATDADVRELARLLRRRRGGRGKTLRDSTTPADWGADLKRRADGSLKEAASYNARLGNRAHDALPSALTDDERLRAAAAEHLRLC